MTALQVELQVFAAVTKSSSWLPKLGSEQAAYQGGNRRLDVLRNGTENRSPLSDLLTKPSALVQRKGKTPPLAANLHDSPVCVKLRKGRGEPSSHYTSCSREAAYS